MSTILGQVRRYWKQLTAAVIFVAAAAVAFSVAFASGYDITLSAPSDAVDGQSWTVGHSETWSASLPELESNEIDYTLLKWKSSDNNVVSVSNASGQGCTLTAVGGGSATITVQYMSDNTENATVLGTQIAEFKVQIEITNDSASLPYGFVYFGGSSVSNFTISTNIASSNVSMTWTSSNESVATVDTTSGVVIKAGSAGGVATITGTPSTNDQSVTLTVVKKIEATTNLTGIVPISLEPNEYFNLYQGTDDSGSTVYYTNVAALSQMLLASESEDYVLTDSDTGYIMGVNAGQKSVYIYPNIDYSSYSATAGYTESELAGLFGTSVTVKVMFGITNGDITGAVGDTVALSTNTTEADNVGVNWTSNNTSVATVDTDGVVTLKSSGTATITATMDNTSLFSGVNQTSSITVTVIDSFSVDQTSNIINVGDTFDLTAIVTDESATVSWISSDESIATVTESASSSTVATVAGISKGTATITAMQEVNGVIKYAYCEVSVNEPVQSVSLYPTSLSITVGDSYPLVLTFEPELPDNMEVKWVSSDEDVLTVSSSGVVTAVGGGDAVISVISVDGIKVASCDVHVRVPVTGITLSKTSVETTMSAGNYQLSYTITPDSDGVDTSVIWSTSNSSILTVDQNGFVTFVAPGNATVICQTNDTGTDGTNLLATCDFFISEPVTSVSLDYTDITLQLGDTFRLTSEVLPLDATDKSVSWISSNTSVVTVDDNGLLTAVGTGSAAVLVQSNDSGVTAMCNVNVYQPVETVEMNYSEMSVRKGTVFWLYATAGPDNAVNKTITWSSSNTSIATVDSTGMVTAIEPGECVITATSQDTGVFATCSVTVTEPVTGITLNYSDVAIYAGDKIAIIPTVTPTDADNKSVTYLSSDTDVATVDENGIVTGLKGGECVILVTTVERGLVASCKVTVYEFVTSVTINETVKYINNGATKAFTASVTPDSATNRGVVWSSSNTSVLTVSQKGVVTAKGLGTATITATAADGSGVFDTVTMTVIKPVSSISVSPSYVTVIEGQSQKVTATVTPSDATLTDIDWSSSNPEVASVDYNGEITGVSAGVCYVYATSTDGNDIVGTVKVTVKKAVPATSVVINSTSVSMFPGQTRALSVRVRPSTSTDDTVWVSSDTSVATVDSNGVVTAKGQGNCVIYCIADSGVEDECEVNVLALNSTSITLEQYDSYILDIYGCTDTITWYTNNNRIATVDTSGKVIARGVGTTTIVAKVNGKLLYCKVTVTKIAK